MERGGWPACACCSNVSALGLQLRVFSIKPSCCLACGSSRALRCTRLAVLHPLDFRPGSGSQANLPAAAGTHTPRRSSWERNIDPKRDTIDVEAETLDDWRDEVMRWVGLIR